MNGTGNEEQLELGTFGPSGRERWNAVRGHAVNGNGTGIRSGNMPDPERMKGDPGPGRESEGGGSGPGVRRGRRTKKVELLALAVKRFVSALALDQRLELF